jgi:hypothetical protein
MSLIEEELSNDQQPQEENKQVQGEEQNSGETSEGEQPTELDVHKLEEFKKDGMYLGKYKNLYETLKGASNAQKELTRLQQLKAPEAPEEYKIDFSADEELHGLEIDTEDEKLKGFLGQAKENNWTQEQVDLALKTYYKEMKEFLPDPVVEKEALGAEAPQLIQKAAQVVKMLPQELQGPMIEASATANGVKALNALHELLKDKSIPDSKVVPVKGKEELQQEAKMFFSEHFKDGEFDSYANREQYEQMYAKAFM